MMCEGPCHREIDAWIATNCLRRYTAREDVLQPSPQHKSNSNARYSAVCVGIARLRKHLWDPPGFHVTSRKGSSTIPSKTNDPVTCCTSAQHLFIIEVLSATMLLNVSDVCGGRYRGITRNRQCVQCTCANQPPKHGVPLFYNEACVPIQFRSRSMPAPLSQPTCSVAG